MDITHVKQDRRRWWYWVGTHIKPEKKRLVPSHKVFARRRQQTGGAKKKLSNNGKWKCLRILTYVLLFRIYDSLRNLSVQIVSTNSTQKTMRMSWVSNFCLLIVMFPPQLTVVIIIIKVSCEMIFSNDCLLLLFSFSLSLFGSFEYLRTNTHTFLANYTNYSHNIFFQ